MKNLFTYILAVGLLCSAVLNAQNKNEKDESGTVVLEAQKITVEPPKPQIALKVKDIKPREYDFFRSFEDEVKAIPPDMIDVKINSTETKIDNYEKILTKERK